MLLEEEYIDLNNIDNLETLKLKKLARKGYIKALPAYTDGTVDYIITDLGIKLRKEFKEHNNI